MRFSLLICILSVLQTSEPRLADVIANVGDVQSIGESWRNARFCGPNSLYLFLKLKDVKVSHKEILDYVPLDESGSSIADLRKCAERFGCPATVIAANVLRGSCRHFSLRSMRVVYGVPIRYLQTFVGEGGVYLAVAAVLSMTQAGCDHIRDASVVSVTEAPTSEHSKSSSRVVVDAGGVFADEANYLCVPFSNIGIDDTDEVVSFGPSCKCASPSIVEFYDPDHQASRALRIDFLAEDGNSHAQVAATRLAVDVALELGHRAQRAIIRMTMARV